MLASGWPSGAARFAIATALGATRRQLRDLVTAEALVLGSVGVAPPVRPSARCWRRCSSRVLTGVFDPPPAAPTIPWGYLALTTLIALTGLAGATVATARRGGHSPITVLREL